MNSNISHLICNVRIRTVITWISRDDVVPIQDRTRAAAKQGHIKLQFFSTLIILNNVEFI